MVLDPAINFANPNNSTTANLGFEAQLWRAADALRSNMDAAQYKHIVLGPIFLKYISDAFKEKYDRLHGLTRDELRYILDPKDVYGPDFPGETFRVLKEKEIKHFGEYRTKRLVLEACDWLEGIEIVNPGGYTAGYRDQDSDSKRSQPVITISQERKEIKPAAAPKEPTRPAVKEQTEEEPAQPSFTDFGLYKCEACGKMVMGFEKVMHEREEHRGRGVEWKRVR